MTPRPCDPVVSCGISRCFHLLSPCTGQIAHALLTRPPLEHFGASSSMSPLDLHVLGTPPAFVLSQDQTLMFNPSLPRSSAPTDSRFRCLSQKSDCSFLLLSFTISFSRTACRLLSLAPTLIIIPYPTRFVNNLFYLFCFLFYSRILCTVLGTQFK